jgi:hypothetical protein
MDPMVTVLLLDALAKSADAAGAEQVDSVISRGDFLSLVLIVVRSGNISFRSSARQN